MLARTRRRLISAAAAVLVTTAAAACGSSTHSGGTKPLSGTSGITEQWDAVGTADGGRVILGQYNDTTSCGIRPDPVTLNIHETDTTVMLAVTRAGHPASTGGCLDMAFSPIVRFRLRAPLDGRRIAGSSWHGGFGWGLIHGKAIKDGSEPDIVVPTVPSVLGVNRADGTRILHLLGLHARFVGAGRAVIGESPAIGRLAPGTTARHPYGGVVTLRLGS